jgi:hypothetical protein
MFFIDRDTIHQKSAISAHENLVILDFFEIQKSRYPDFALEYHGIDPIIVKKMERFEPTILKMYDRVPGFASYQQRKDAYKKHLIFCYNLITKTDLRLFISSNIPHECFDYILYKMCTVFNIPTFIFFQSATIPDTAFIYDSETEFSVTLRDRFRELVCKPEIPLLCQEYEEYYRRHINIECDNKPFYMEDTRKPLLGKIWNYFRKKAPVKRLLDRIKKLFVERNRDRSVKKYYASIVRYPDFSRAYIYFALQFQPELTTCPIGDIFVEQEYAIQALSQAVPDDVFIYIKEHPRQYFLYHGMEFYRSISLLRNVCFIHSDFSSKKLIEHSLCVSTCTGTIGWESLFLGKHVLLFSSIYYMHARGVHSVRTFEDCKMAIRDILATENDDSHIIDMKKYLKAIEDTAARVTIDPVYYHTGKPIDISDNNKKIFAYLDAEITKITGENPVYPR